MELQGKVIAVLPERSGVSARGEWKSQEFVVEYQSGQYPRRLHFNVFGADRLARFNIQIGQFVNVAFDIDAREWNGRWFSDIRAYDVRQVDPNAVAAPMAQADPFAQPAAAYAQPAQPVAQPTSSPATESAFPPASDGEEESSQLPF